MLSFSAMSEDLFLFCAANQRFPLFSLQCICPFSLDPDVIFAQLPDPLPVTHHTGQMVIAPESIHQQVVGFADLLLSSLPVIFPAADTGLLSLLIKSDSQVIFSLNSVYPIPMQSALWASLPPKTGFSYVSAMDRAPALLSGDSHALKLSTKSNSSITAIWLRRVRVFMMLRYFSPQG